MNEIKDEKQNRPDAFAKAAAFAAAFIFILCGVLLFALPDREYSEAENRYLKGKPQVTFSNLFDGSYMDDVNEYLTDQFPFRDAWISLQSGMQQALGKKQINGVYLAADNYLIAQYDSPQNTDRIKNTFQKFAKAVSEKREDVSKYLMLVPSAITIYADKLPEYAGNASQVDTINEIYDYVSELESESASEDVATVDVYGYLMRSDIQSQTADKQLFYKTDHHWTTIGAYYGYQALCERMGIVPLSIDEYDRQYVTYDFHGTYSARVNLPGEKGDAICLFNRKQEKLKVLYEDSGEITDSLYNLEYLEKKDKYSLFLNNLHPLVVVEIENNNTGKNLVLVKDSYANSLIPFLTAHFDIIYVFDPRYYKGSISDFIMEHAEVTDVLVLYNMSTIDTDTGIRAIF
ncbi:MAG: hypothetical protein KBS85_00580 [Lachnospiraceae bacterium]|nr:hypothetical protein [Candidatus Merdinaster equi]